MLNEFFSFESYELIDTLIIDHYNTTLIQDIGEYKKGIKIDTISFNFSEGKMDFYLKDKAEPIASFNFKLELIND